MSDTSTYVSSSIRTTGRSAPAGPMRIRYTVSPPGWPPASGRPDCCGGIVGSVHRVAPPGRRRQAADADVGEEQPSRVRELVELFCGEFLAGGGDQQGAEVTADERHAGRVWGRHPDDGQLLTIWCVATDLAGAP